jgi:hypothetical protein
LVQLDQKGTRFMRVTSRSEDEVKKLSSRKLLKPGWHSAEFNEVTEKTSQNGNEMLECGLLVGDEKIPVTDWLVDVKGGAAKLRSAVVAVGALEHYQSAGEIGPEDFIGRRCEAKISIQQRRGFRYMVVEEYRAVAASPVVNLRSA